MKANHGMKKNHEQHPHDHEGTVNHDQGTQHQHKSDTKGESEHLIDARINKTGKLSRNHGNEHAGGHGKRSTRVHRKERTSVIHPHSDRHPA